jgi:hypothetical protein
VLKRPRAGRAAPVAPAAPAVLRRERLARIAGTVPLAATAALFLFASFEPADPLALWLAPSMPLEAIVVHAGVLFGLAVFAWPSTLRGHLYYWTGLGALALLYTWAAFDLGGSATLAQFALLVLLTYGGVLWVPARRRTTVGVETALRWFIGAMAIPLCFGLAGAPPSVAEWHDIQSRMIAGALYFGLLAAIEATGLYVALRRVGAAHEHA